jgi:hypothetical protein
MKLFARAVVAAALALAAPSALAAEREILPIPRAGHEGHEGERPRLRRAAAATDGLEGDVTPGEEIVNLADRGSGTRELLRFVRGPLAISPLVLIQVQAAPYVGADSYLPAGDPAERGGFRMRRARFGFDGRLFRRVPFRISAEFNTDARGTALLYDAWFGYDRFKPVQVFVGTHNIPFSRSGILGAGNMALIERPLAVRAMAPFYQLGAHLEGHFWKGALSYYAGVYNGLERTDQFFQGYTQNAAIFGNRFGGLTYAGRLESAPLGDVGSTIDDPNHSKFRIAAGASAFYSNAGTRNIWGAGGDILMHFRGLHILGEFLANRTTPVEVPTQPLSQPLNITSFGVVAEAGYVIIKQRFGVNARFEWIDANTGVQNEADTWLVTGGVSYRVYRDIMKAQLDYTHREEVHGKSLKNDSVLIGLQLNL